MDKKQLCTLEDARAYIDGLMDEVQENSPVWEVLNEAWCILDKSIEENEK